MVQFREKLINSVQLETNAILVTNGDDDTRPGWILIKIVGKPDLSIFHIQ